MTDCCEKTVPQSDSSYETFARPVADWQARLTAGLNQSVQAADQTLGHLEEQILQQTRGLDLFFRYSPMRLLVRQPS